MTPTQKFDAMLPYCDKLAKRIAKRFHRLRMQEDFVQVSRTALWECALRHTEETGDFWAFSRIRIQGACLDWVRTTSWFSRTMCKVATMRSLNHSSRLGFASGDGVDADDSYELQDRLLSNSGGVDLDGPAYGSDINPTYDEDHDFTFRDVADEQYRDHVNKRIGAATRSLPENQRKVIEAFLADKPMKDVAEELGVSPGRVSQLLSQALASLRGISV